MPPRDVQGAKAAPRRPRRGNSVSAIAHAVAQAAPHPAAAPGAQHRPVSQSPVFGPLHAADQPIHQALRQATQSVQRAKGREPSPAPTPGQQDVFRHVAAAIPQTIHAQHLVAPHDDPVIRADLGTEAQAAHNNKPFDAQKVMRAIELGLPSAQNLANINGTIWRRDNRDKGLMQHVLGLGGTPVPLDPVNGGIQLHSGDKVRAQQATMAQAADPVSAPVLKTLGLLAVPSHEIAKGAGALTGHPGTQNFGQLLSKIGAPRAVAGPVGFGLDVATDPVTYASFGAGSVAEKAGQRAAEDAARRATQAGMSESAAQMVGRRLGDQAAAAAPAGRGITASLAGHELPFVRNLTAAAGRGLGAAAAHAPQGAKGFGAWLKDVATNVRPTMAPAGVDSAQYTAARQAARQSRAAVNQSLPMLERQARSLRQHIGPDNYGQVIDAVEKGQVGSLPQELREPAVWLRSQYRHAKRLRRQAGLSEGTIRDYFPHAQEGPLRQGLGLEESTSTTRPYRGGQRTLQAPGSSKERTMRVPISEANPQLAAEGKGQFSTDIPLVHLNYMSETHKAAARSEFLKNLADVGRPARVGMTLRPGEQVYHLGFQSGRFGLRPVSEADWKAGRVPKDGRLVALDQHTVDTATGIAQPAQATNSVARGYDRFTRGFKGLATATPGFHLRNLVGDVQMAYLSQPGHRLIPNLIQGGRATRAMFDQQRAIGNLGSDLVASGKTIKIAGQQTPMEDFVGLAQRHGVVQSGYVGRELSDLGGQSTRKGLKRVTSNIGRNVQGAIQAREDLVRLATFKHGLDSGMTPARAADLSLETHIDYGELTPFERTVMRRIAPFYTFSARALPLHAKRLVQRPGKFATYEKAREEGGVATGHDNLAKDQGNFTPWDQRQAPFLLGNRVVSNSLPLNLLNELPSTNVSVPQYTGELSQFALGLLNPLPKDALELAANRSFYFRRDIQDKNKPLVAAPSWVAALPSGLRKQLGVTKILDKKSGQMVWGWPGKVDYVAKSLPGPVNALNQATTVGTNRRGQTPLESVASPLTGLKMTTLDPTTAEIDRLYNRQAQIAEEMAGMRQRQMQATPHYLALSQENRMINQRLQILSRRRGDANVIGAKRTGGSSSGYGASGFGGYGTSGYGP